MSADTLCWTDIPVTNLDRAIKFYSAVLTKKSGNCQKAVQNMVSCRTKNKMRPVAYAFAAIAAASITPLRQMDR